MVKKFTASAQQLKPDTRFDSKLLSKFVNCLMHDGKKSVATRVVYDALEMIQKQLPDEDPLDVFVTAVENVKPAIEVRSKRVGGATYQ
ncbi:MAG: 30S ribosomal protein S7, partial [Fuerstiella sp.]